MLSVFMTCCRDGEVEEAKQALVDGQDPNERDLDDGCTGLMLAVHNEHNDIVELLLKQPELDINSVEKIGDTALHVAGYSGNLWAVKKLVSDPRIKTLNSRNNDGQTPLIGAVRMGDVDCVRELVKIPGVDLHKISPQGRTLEEMACEACDENEPKVIDKKGEIVSIIKNARLKKTKVFAQYCMDGKVEEAKQALIDGQDPNEKTEYYHSLTPLALAVTKKQNDIVELLLEQPQIDINCANNYGDTALHYACLFNNPLAVANLGNDPRIRTVNSRNKNGVTPLMHAVRKGNVDCVREVVKLPGIHLFKSYLYKPDKNRTNEITLEDITCELVKSKKKEVKGIILNLLQNARHYWDKCEYCDYTSDKRSNLDKHVKETHKKLEQKPLCCNHCDYTTVRQGDLKKHIKETHEKLEQNLLHCNHCDYTTVRQGNLNRHMLTHANKVHTIGKFKCDKCDFSDDKKNRLTQHLKRKHPMVDNVFECRECDFRTLLEDELGKHIKEQHSKKHKI